MPGAHPQRRLPSLALAALALIAPLGAAQMAGAQTAQTDGGSVVDARALSGLQGAFEGLALELGRLQQEIAAQEAARPPAPAPQSTAASLAPGTLRRIDEMEAQLASLIAKVEGTELRLERVIADATNRIGDIEFRLCELTPSCDFADLGPVVPLGGEAPVAEELFRDAAPGAPLSSPPEAPAPAVPSTPSASPAPEAAPAVPFLSFAPSPEAEAAFARAHQALKEGNLTRAATLFDDFIRAYPNSPLVQEAQYLRGNALRESGQTADAARAYLSAFQRDERGVFAAESLLKLAEGLQDLGQSSEACVTYNEVVRRFPSNQVAEQARSAIGFLGC